MFFGVMLGTFCIALGISIILKTFFKIDIQVVKPFVAIMLILTGTSMLRDTFFHRQAHITINY